MSTQSKVTSTRSNSKSVSRPKAIYLTPELRVQKANSKAIKEFHNFLDTATKAEMRVVGHLIVGNYTREDLMKEVRRLLGESAAKCKVIQFPVRNHQCKSAMEA